VGLSGGTASGNAVGYGDLLEVVSDGVAVGAMVGSGGAEYVSSGAID
jgi:autotransporter passenger strand-loop-strand repeat protein